MAEEKNQPQSEEPAKGPEKLPTKPFEPREVAPREKTDTPEMCVGCGAVAPETEDPKTSKKHPMIMVTFDEDEEPIDYPVCAACHADPSSAKNKMKGHFFPRNQRRVALSQAGNPNLGG